MAKVGRKASNLVAADRFSARTVSFAGFVLGHRLARARLQRANRVFHRRYSELLSDARAASWPNR